jgi:hypothetical protein
VSNIIVDAPKKKEFKNNGIDVNNTFGYFKHVKCENCSKYISFVK